QIYYIDISPLNRSTPQKREPIPALFSLLLYFFLTQNLNTPSSSVCCTSSCPPDLAQAAISACDPLSVSWISKTCPESISVIAFFARTTGIGQAKPFASKN